MPGLADMCGWRTKKGRGYGGEERGRRGGRRRDIPYELSPIPNHLPSN